MSVPARFTDLIAVWGKLVLMRNHDLLFPVLINFESLNRRYLRAILICVRHVDLGVHLLSLRAGTLLSILAFLSINEITQHVFDVVQNGWLRFDVFRHLLIKNLCWRRRLIAVLATAFLD